MKFNHLLARGAVAAVLAASIGAVCAAETSTTEIQLPGKDQKRESLKFEGELPVGESRGLYTDAGTPVTVFRTEKGLRIETPQRTVDVPYPDHAAILAGDGDLLIGDGADGKKKRVVILRHNEAHTDDDATHADQHDKLMKRVIVLGDGGDVNVKVLKLDELGQLADLEGLEGLKDLDRLESLDKLDALEGHDNRVIVIRKSEKRAIQVD